MGSWLIQKINDAKGFGMFATNDIVSNSTILEEEPLVSCQFSWNKLYKYKACDYCMKSLESAEVMCRRLLQNECFVLPFPECCPLSLVKIVQCPECKTEYCSVECREAAYKKYHQVICPTSGRLNINALEELEETWRNFHYPPETTTIMLLVRMIAQIKQEGCDVKLRNAIEQFCHAYRNDAEGLVHKLLGEQFQTQLCVLLEQIKEHFYEESVSHWFTVEGFQTLFALLGANQQGVGTSSLSVWVRNCENKELSEDERMNFDTFVDNLYENLNEVAGSFLDCEGSGLYETQSKCNHSCSPNAQVCFLHNNNRLTLKALRHISPGEEITISYMSDCQLSRSRYSRQKFLKENYLFTCFCEKCRAEIDDPDRTSSSEDNDSDLEMELS